MPQAEEFDNHASKYTDSIDQSIAFSGCDHAFFTAMKAAVIGDFLAANGIGNSPRLLDVGCGVGAIHPHVAGLPEKPEVIGVDVSAASIELAKTRNPSGRFLHYDGRRLPFEDNTFDAAYAICVLHHVSPLDRPGFMAEFNRIVRPGGLGILIEHNPWNPFTRHVVANCEMDRDAILLPSGECRQLLDSVGFERIANRYVAFLPFDAGWARQIESFMGWIPLGAQYAVCGTCR